MTELSFKSTVDVELVDKMGGDERIAHAARVSTCGVACQEHIEEKELVGLINYLMEHRHGSPFEHSCLTFFVRAPIFVWREYHRHRIGHSFNEESGRYKQLSPVFYLPAVDRPMFKVDGWKPGRPKFARMHSEGRPPGDSAKFVGLCENLKQSYALAYRMYEENLAMGFDPGLARACLPVGIYSACWVTVNPRSLMHFLSLRTHEPAAAKVSYPLYEIELAARACEETFAEGWPVTYAAWVKHGRVAP